MRDTQIVVGFDFGMKYIGTAIGNTYTKTANPNTCLKAIDGVPNWSSVAEIIDNWKPSKLIVGLPINSDGRYQEITYCAKSFGKKLSNRFSIPVEFIDETLSTWQAKQSNLDVKQINIVSAQIILQQWLNENYK